MAEGTPANLWDIYTGPMPSYERGPAPPSNVIPPELMQTEVQAGYPVVPGAGSAMRALQGLVRPPRGRAPADVIGISQAQAAPRELSFRAPEAPPTAGTPVGTKPSISLKDLLNRAGKEAFRWDLRALEEEDAGKAPDLSREKLDRLNRNRKPAPTAADVQSAVKRRVRQNEEDVVKSFVRRDETGALGYLRHRLRSHEALPGFFEKSHDRLLSAMTERENKLYTTARREGMNLPWMSGSELAEQGVSAEAPHIKEAEGAFSRWYQSNRKVIDRFSSLYDTHEKANSPLGRKLIKVMEDDLLKSWRQFLKE